MTTIYHDILAAVSVSDAAQIEAARRELESRAEPLRGSQPAETRQVSETENKTVRATVATLFANSIASDGLISTCVEARRAVTQLIEAAGGEE